MKRAELLALPVGEITSHLKKNFSQPQLRVAVKTVRLRKRSINPDGRFDKAGRWYPDKFTDSMDQIRSPSRGFPYSYMSHARTVEYQSQLAGTDPDKTKKAFLLLSWLTNNGIDLNEVTK